MSENQTRFNIPRDPRNPEDHVDSGYEGDDVATEYIPPCGIADADIALHQLFDRDIGFTIKTISSANGKLQIKKPSVIFATGERFALAKRSRPPRDRNNTLMLPAISIRRKTVEQTNGDITSRGMNQFTGNMVVKRRLAEEDRDYQNLINKFGFKHMQLSATSTRDDMNENANDPEIEQGGLLSPLYGNNIWEIITIPQPQFFTATYEVMFWTNFTQHMNYMIETFFSSFLPNDRSHKLVTDKGYWFLAHTEDIMSSQENFDEIKEEERLLKYSFNIKVRGYIIAPDNATGLCPIRRWISAPVVKFETHAVTSDVVPRDHMERPPQKSDDTYTLTDIEQGQSTKQTPTTMDRFLIKKTVVNPITGKSKLKYVSILSNNQARGETVYYASDVETLDEFIKSIK